MRTTKLLQKMTKEEFVTLQSELQQSGKTIKSYLQEKGVHYSTYHYWCNKFSGDTATDKLAPISIESAERTPHSPAMDIQPCGATLLFPNGLRAHFGSGTENLLRELLDKSLEGHVQP